MIAFRRLILFVGLAIALGTILVARIMDIQLWRGDKFRVLADDNRLYTLPLPAERGVLLDRYGEPLVWNSRRYYRVLNPTDLHPELKLISTEEALSEMATASGNVESRSERMYRFPLALSHVLGYVGLVTADDLVEDNRLKIQDQKGKLGLELLFDQLLRGRDGQTEYEIDALGRRQKKVKEIPAQVGQNVTTTLDPYLSQVAYQALGNQTGSVVIMDAATAEVLALVNTPAFDPNILTRTASNPEEAQVRQKLISSLFSDSRQLFFNRAISGQYPPGSVFKLITALAALSDGKIDESTTVVDEGTLKVGEYEYGNWYFRQYGLTEGPIQLVKAIARSNDIYFYKAAEAVGPDTLAAMARVFGLGQPTNIGLRPEAAGLVPNPAWKELKTGERWFLGNTYHYGIGQGDVLVSPLQIAQAVQSLAHQGSRCQPKLVSSKTQDCHESSFKDEQLALVLRGMLDACSPGGTGFPFFKDNSDKRGGATPQEDLAKGAVACKTGTAEFGGANELGHRRTHGWFVAIREFNKDEVINAVPTENFGAAAATASAQLEPTSLNPAELRQKWVAGLKDHSLPQRLVFVALVESDETQPFKEGSRDAGPVIKQVVDWMYGR